MFFFRKKYSDEELIELIRSANTKDEYRAAQFVQKDYFPIVKLKLKNQPKLKGKSIEIFDDSVLALFRNIRKGTEIRTASLKTYFSGIVDNQISNYLKKGKNSQLTDSTEGLENELRNEIHVFDAIINEEEKTKMAELILALPDNCQEIIIATFYNKISNVTFAEMHNVNAKTVAKRKERCLEKLRKLVNESKFFH